MKPRHLPFHAGLSSSPSSGPLNLTLSLHFSPWVLGLALVLNLVCGGSASGQTTNSWIGENSADLTTAGNYAAGGSVAADGNPTALFVFGREAPTNTALVATAEFKANRILFEGATSFTLTNTGQFNFVGASDGITQSSSAAQTLAGGIKVTDGPLTLSGDGAGLVTLSGTSNDYASIGLSKTGSSAFLFSSGNAINTGTVTINGGTLALGSGTSLTGVIQLRGGVLATSGSFTRARGTGTGNVNFGNGGGGFAAYGGALTVSTALGTWALSPSALFGNSPLILGSSIADNVVTLTSTLGLGAAAREIRLVDNPNSANDRAVMSGVISGTGGGLTLTGSGTLTLSGTNTYTGVTTLRGGVLSVATIGNGGVAGNLGQATSSAGNLVFNGGTLQYTGATASTNRGFTVNNGMTGTIDVTTNTLTISGAANPSTGALTKAGAGTLILSSNSINYTGTTTISAGTLQIGAGGTSGKLSTSSAITNNSALRFNRTNTLTQGTDFGTISGTGTLTQAGSGTLVLSAANTYTGDTTVQAGTLELGSNLALQNSNLDTSGAGVVSLSSVTTPTLGGLSGSRDLASAITTGYGSMTALTLNPQTGISNTYSGVISDGAAGMTLTKTGAGTQVLSGANTYTGGTTISAGTLSVGSGSTTGSIAGNVTNNGALAFNRSDDLTFAGIISGTGAVTKDGAGTLTLTGTNSYSGGTTVSAGSLVGTTSSLQGAATNNATVKFDQSTDGTYGGVMSGSGSLEKLGSGTLTLTGANTYRGGTTLSGGTLTAGHVSAFGTGALSIGAGTFLDLAGLDISNTLTNNGGTILNAGTLAGGNFNGGTTDLSGANSTVTEVTGTATVNVSGTDTTITNVSGGTLNVNAAGTTIQTFNGGNIVVATGQSVTINEGTSSGTVSGAGGLTKAGTNTLVLSGNNNFTGPLNISGGIVSLSTNAAVAGTSGVNLSDGTGLTYTGGAGTIDRNITVTDGTGTLRNTGPGPLALTGNLSKNGTVLTFAGGTFTIGGVISGASANSDLIVDGATVALNNTNTYNGPTYLRNGGALSANVAGAMPTSPRSEVIMDDTGTGSSSLTLAASQEIASLTGAASSGVSLDVGTSLTLGGTTGNTTFAGVISGSGGLIKDGASTQTISGANTYSGTTTVSAGTLALSGAAGALTATSGVIINGGTLVLSGSAADRISNTASISLGGATDSILQLSGAVTETMGALTLTGGVGKRVIDFGATSGVLTFASLSAVSNLPLEIWNWSGIPNGGGGTDRIIISSGNLGGSLLLSDISFYSDSGTTAYPETAFTASGELVPVPEATPLLGVLGLMAPLAWRERRHWMRCRSARG